MQFIRTIAAVATLSARDRASAVAQDWPTRHLTLVVPFSAGGSSDAIARIVADGISSNLRQPVVVENVAGVGGLVGGSRVAKAAPDGYQFVIGNVGTFAQSPWLYKHPLYNSVTDFAPVALLTDESLVLVARPTSPPTICSSSSPTRRQTRTKCTSLVGRRRLQSPRLHAAQFRDRHRGHARPLSQRRAGDAGRHGGPGGLRLPESPPCAAADCRQDREANRDSE